jgi:hypothetical protein
LRFPADKFEIHNKKKWRKVNVWSIKGPLLLLALLVGALSEYFHWGGAPFAAGVAMIIPIIGFRKFWMKTRFWITVVVLGIAQVPLVVYLNPVIDRYRIPSMLAFGIADCLVVILALSFICSLIQNEKA